MKTIALVYTLLMAGITAVVLVLILTGVHRSTMPVVDILAVPALWAATLLIVFRPDRKPTNKDDDV